MYLLTVFENHRKKSHSTLRAKRATFTFWVNKSSLKMPKMETCNCSQTVLPDRSLLIGQKLVKNAKIKKCHMRHFWVIFKHCGAAKVSNFVPKMFSLSVSRGVTCAFVFGLTGLRAAAALVWELMIEHLLRLRDKLFLQYHHWKNERDDDLLVFIFLGNGPFSSAIQTVLWTEQKQANQLQGQIHFLSTAKGHFFSLL